MKKLKILDYVRITDKKESLYCFRTNRIAEKVIVTLLTVSLMAVVGYGLFNIFKNL
jgi:hypothetical protein